MTDLSLAENNFVAAFRTIQNAVHKNAIDHGWWDEPREDGTILALTHGEVSECMEALRTGEPRDTHCPEFLNSEVELADVIIRIMDFAEKKGYRLGRAILGKHAFNKTRPYKHGGKQF